MTTIDSRQINFNFLNLLLLVFAYKKCMITFFSINIKAEEILDLAKFIIAKFVKSN